MSVLATALKPLFGVEPTHLPRLTAQAGATAARLQQVVYTVTECCELTLLTPNHDTLRQALDAYPEELRGFAYEGAGVALAALDVIAPWRNRTREFTAGPARPYRYAIYLGAGMGLARIHHPTRRFRARLNDPLFDWVVLDGYGFHEGFFAHRRYVQEQATPPRVSGYAHRAFDHGLGRSIWFATGADPDRIARTITAFDTPRRRDLWAGIGLACGYTGGVPIGDIHTLADLAGSYRDRIAEGVLVAAKNRHDVGNPADHNEIATTVLCGLSSRDAAAAADAALTDLPDDDIEPAYEIWRTRLRRNATQPVTQTLRRAS